MTGGEVKWLYPGAEKSTLGMDSEGTDQSIQGDSENPSSAGADSCNNSAPSSPLEELGVPVDQLSSTVAAASTYVGSLWGGWSKKDEKSTDKNNENTEVAEVKDSKRGSMTGGLGMMSSAFGKLSSFSKAAPLEQETENKSDETEEKESGGYFSAASLGAGLSSLTSSLTMENLYSATGATTAKDQEEKDIKAEKEEETEEKEDWSSWSKGAFSKVGQLTSNYSKVLHETVSKAPIIADFNQEQEEFIKSKAGKEQESAPWSGYQGEEELREKILALSEDRRNFLRAPPQGVDFDFEYSAVAAHAVVLLGEDPRLREMRYELVPKKVKEDEFWRNYFYRVGLAKQSFELAPVAPITSTATAKSTNSNTTTSNRSMDDVEDGRGDQEDEFLSEQQEASSRDLQEADEAMKKLGLAKNDAEWEAELEGELNEYEMVGGEEGDELNEDQIQALLEAEK